VVADQAMTSLVAGVNGEEDPHDLAVPAGQLEVVGTTSGTSGPSATIGRPP
jgi:hypothetical protein